MPNNRISDLKIENARIIFRNFSGKEGRFNPSGNRNFCVLIDNDTAAEMRNDGWNIKYLRPRDPEDEPQAYLPVAVKFDNVPPTVYEITSKGKTQLNEDTIGRLDWLEVKTFDVRITPYRWEMNGNTGIKAYLGSLYAVLVEDDFANKYYDIPDAADLYE